MNRTLVLLLCALWLLGPWAGVRAQGEGGAMPAAGAPAAKAQEHGPGARHPRTLEMSNAAFFKNQYAHNVPYPKWISIAVLVLIFVPVLRSFREGRRPGRFVRIFRGFCHWVRDEMVYAVMGKEEGRRFAPYFLFLFFFVAAMNVLGLIPSWEGLWSTYTATGTPNVTGVLALITLCTMLFFGMRKQGVIGFFKNLVPHGLPVFLLPLMVPVELIGLIVKPFALMIRLFANMLAGHLIVASMIGLIFLFAKMQDGAVTSYATAGAAVGMAVFIFIIEAFVTLLQAYVFTYLSIIFLHLAMHPEH
jgi:F-type H+-transporting ATPase subunit a